MGRVSKVKVSDRIKRIELIGKHIGVGAFEEKKAISGNVTVNIIKRTYGD